MVPGRGDPLPPLSPPPPPPPPSRSRDWMKRKIVCVDICLVQDSSSNVRGWDRPREWQINLSVDRVDRIRYWTVVVFVLEMLHLRFFWPRLISLAGSCRAAPRRASPNRSPHHIDIDLNAIDRKPIDVQVWSFWNSGCLNAKWKKGKYFFTFDTQLVTWSRVSCTSRERTCLKIIFLQECKEKEKKGESTIRSKYHLR